MMAVRTSLHAWTSTQTSCDISIGIHHCILHDHIMSAMVSMTFYGSVEDLVRVPFPGIVLFKVADLNNPPDPVAEEEHPLKFFLLTVENCIQLIFVFQRLKFWGGQVFKRRKCSINPIRGIVRPCNGKRLLFAATQR